MRWRVLVVRPNGSPLEPLLDVFRRVGVDASCHAVDHGGAVVDALDGEEWDVVIYDPAVLSAAPIELVYAHAPAAAIVVLTTLDDVADELARVAATRADLDDA